MLYHEASRCHALWTLGAPLEFRYGVQWTRNCLPLLEGQLACAASGQLFHKRLQPAWRILLSSANHRCVMHTAQALRCLMLRCNINRIEYYNSKFKFEVHLEPGWSYSLWVHCAWWHRSAASDPEEVNEKLAPVAPAQYLAAIMSNFQYIC